MTHTATAVEMIRLLRTDEKNTGSPKRFCHCASVNGFASWKKPYRRMNEPSTRKVSGATIATANQPKHMALATQPQRPRCIGAAV